MYVCMYVCMQGIIGPVVVVGVRPLGAREGGSMRELEGKEICEIKHETL